MIMIKEDINQKTLNEFFELIEKNTWQNTLHNLIRKYGMNIWDLNVSELLDKLIQDAYDKENLKHASLIVLICTILLKSKARRIGLRELEQNIKEELNEIQNLNENPLENLPENEELIAKYNELLELEKKLKNMFYRVDNKGKEKRKKNFDYLIKIESYFKLKTRIYDFLQNKKETTYFELKNNIKTTNSLIISLLLLNNENKISLKQKKPYDNIEIKTISDL